MFALVLSHVFISYFVSLPSVLDMVQRNPAEHPTAFTWVVVMSGILYFNFAWFREQLCLIICPYGRLQSAMTDRDTMVIGYDWKRVELESLASTYLPVLAILPADQMRPGLKVQVTISMEGHDDSKSSRLVEAPFVGPGS